MDPNDNLKRIFDNQESNVPDFLDWSEMESGIKQKMYASESVDRSIRIRTWLRRLFIGSTVLLLLIPLTCNLSKLGVENVEPAKVDESKKHLSITDPVNTFSKTPTTTVKDIISLEENRSIQPPVSSTVLQNSNNARNEVFLDSEDINRADTKERIETNTITNPRFKVTGMQHEHLLRESTPSLPGRILVLAIPRSEIIFLRPNNSITNKTSGKALHTLSLFASPNTWKMNWNPDMSVETDLEKELWSFGYGARYQRNMKYNLFIRVGLDYQRLERRLEWSEIIENYPLELKDVILGYEHNAVNSELIPIIGDTIVYVHAERNVRHFNRSEQIQIPLSLGYNKSVGQFKTNLSGGLAVAIWKRHHGQSIDDGILASYTERPIFNSDISISGFVEAGIAYPISKKTSIGFSFMAQKVYSNWSHSKDFVIRPTVFNTRFVVNYNL